MAAKRKAVKSKRRHEVRLRISQGLPLAKQNAALEFRIYSGRRTLGTIGIGRGSFVWWGRKWKRGRWWTWEQFAALMEG